MNLYFQDDAERYRRAYEAYEQFQAMTNQQAEGSGSGIKRTRTYIPRDQEKAEQRLLEDYFGNDNTPPKYPKENFRRRQQIDALGRNSIGPILKITSVIRQLAYGTTPDEFDEYLQIVERCSRDCLDNFTKCIYILYVEEYLRKPSLEDIEKTYALHEEKHGLPGILGSIDCMHWDWKNCPKALHGQFKRKDHKYPTLMLEAVADQRLWIWHAYFGVPESNNDLNVLYGSPLFDDVLADTAPEAPFVVNERTYKQGYYLADGIYLTWSTFVKTFSIAMDEKTLKFKRVQESARKYIERAFGVLQGRWVIIRQPARALQINTLKGIMYCCIILHKKILQSEKFELSNFKDMFVNPETNMQRTWIERCDLHVRRSKELRDSLVHNELRHDLMNHLWNLDH
ncbi:ALP1-like protein isoform X1 [Tanacetum coccineum]